MERGASGGGQVAEVGEWVAEGEDEPGQQGQPC